ncbi:MAG: hypothetical protein KJI69_01650 [Patescibacteria group bacterium]|nr:hypothetical protein [Patescibacteria group bacterium]
MGNIIFIFKTNGNYLGFIEGGFVFSRDGVYLGWVDGNTVWDSEGNFRGVIANDKDMNKFIIRDRFALSPVSRTPKTAPENPSIPDPPRNIVPVSFGVSMIDSF